jgi:integral membrane protein
MAIDRKRVERAEKFFRVTAVITGVMLLLLTAEMILKYLFGVEIEAFGQFGFLAFVPTDTVAAVNVSTLILIVHGWLYVVYLIGCFQIWTAMRWSVLWFPVLAAGGVVPFLSFFTERRVRTIVEKTLS